MAGAFMVACQSNKANDATDSQVAVTAPATSDATAAPDAPVMTFEKATYDFGKLKQGESVQYIFKFKNTGKTPLIISDASATCGCTVPEPPKDPIMPGKDGEIKVVFNSTGKMGVQDKVVTITSNANPTVSEVHLIGEVIEN